MRIGERFGPQMNTDKRKGERRLSEGDLVPTLRVGMPSWPLRGLQAGRKTTRSVEDGIP
jgi:hypothetical protein